MDSFGKFNQIAFKLLTEMEEPKGKEEKSSIPVKMKCEMKKDFKPHFKMGETVEVVQEGNKTKVFKLGVEGANPIELDQKQTEELLGNIGNSKEKMNEISMTDITSWISKAREGATSLSDKYKRLRVALAGAKNWETLQRDKNIKAASDNLVAAFKQFGINITPESISQSLKTMFERTLARAEEKAKSKSQPTAQPATPTPKPPAGSTAADEKDLGAGENIEEEAGGFKPPKAKFVEKNAAKPKKAKKIGAFRGGKVGSGTTAPKE